MLIEDEFKLFLMTHHMDQIKKSLESGNTGDHCSILINSGDLRDPGGLLKELITNPVATINRLDNVLRSVAKSISNGISGEIDKNKLMPLRNFHIRFSTIPSSELLCKSEIPGNDFANQFLAVSGTIIRMSAPSILVYQKDFMCSKCRFVFPVQGDFEQFGLISNPVKCENPNLCNSVRFKAVPNEGRTYTKDFQEIKIQETLNRVSAGRMPKSLWIYLEDDLIGKCHPGDDITALGVMMRRWKGFKADKRTLIEVVLRANNISLNNVEFDKSTAVETEMLKLFSSFWERHQHNPLSGRNDILQNFCPQIYGSYVVKLAMSVVLASGVVKTDETGSNVRGQSHILLVGDPGTGKSHFLKYAAMLMDRSILTTGIGSTNAGLTVAAIKENGNWQLEAGALVLADGGVCCIDEFNLISEQDRSCIHEAMEQQTISVAKAGMISKLRTRTTIIAATNPKGEYDREHPLTVNTALGSPLLSRFDLVLLLLDHRDLKWDSLLSQHCLNNAIAGEFEKSAAKSSTSGWSLEQMQAYFRYIKLLTPVLTKDAQIVLQEYYKQKRKASDRMTSRITIRFLESCIRLAHGHAKLMFREEVLVMDAIVAILLCEASSMQDSTMLPGMNTIQTDFSDNPHCEYATQAELVLKKLDLPDLLEIEVKRTKL